MAKLIKNAYQVRAVNLVNFFNKFLDLAEQKFFELVSDEDGVGLVRNWVEYSQSVMYSRNNDRQRASYTNVRRRKIFAVDDYLYREEHDRFHTNLSSYDDFLIGGR